MNSPCIFVSIICNCSIYVRVLSMRLRPTRALYAVILFSICVLICILVRLKRPHFTKTCVYPVSFQNNLHVLSHRVHHVLSLLKVTHCLCYGALWGQIRRSQTLPWESDVEFCIRNEELSSIDFSFINLLFQKQNMTISYDSAEGVYSVTDESFQPGASVHLIAFEKETLVDNMRRIGWKRRMLPPNCEDTTSLECFPARLMNKPLPLREFGGKALPVPREDIEILKYHYADNWWLEKLPFNC